MFDEKVTFVGRGFGFVLAASVVELVHLGDTVGMLRCVPWLTAVPVPVPVPAVMYFVEYTVNFKVVVRFCEGHFVLVVA